MTNDTAISADMPDFVAAVEETWGLPTPLDPARSELFGQYHHPRANGFLRYDAPSRTWSHLDEADRTVLFDGSWASETELEVAFLMEELRRYQPTDIPTNTDAEVREAPFVFSGWELQWVFVPVLRRWELAPIGRA